MIKRKKRRVPTPHRTIVYVQYHHHGETMHWPLNHVAIRRQLLRLHVANGGPHLSSSSPTGNHATPYLPRLQKATTPHSLFLIANRWPHHVSSSSTTGQGDYVFSSSPTGEDDYVSSSSPTGDDAKSPPRRQRVAKPILHLITNGRRSQVSTSSPTDEDDSVSSLSPTRRQHRNSRSCA